MNEQLSIFKHDYFKYELHLVYDLKDLYSRKDTNVVFSRFISRGEVLCYTYIISHVDK
jgi:hypothetical protein